MLTTDKKQRKEMPIARGVLSYFPNAIAEVAHVSFVGNRQHNPGEEMHWAREKSRDHADCIARHLIERGTFDEDGMRHSAKAAWRALAMLQLEIEAEQTPTAPVEEGEFSTPFTEPLHQWMYRKLTALGCPLEVAAQITAGTTLTSRLELIPAFVYVAGPMRGYDKFNFPAFDAARDAMLAKGFNVISPADIDRVTDKNADDPAMIDVTDQSRFVLRDFWAIFFLKKIDERGRNGLTLLDNWRLSTGASSEFGIAKWLDLRFYAPNGMDYFANGGKCPKGFVIGEK